MKSRGAINEDPPINKTLLLESGKSRRPLNSYG